MKKNKQKKHFIKTEKDKWQKETLERFIKMSTRTLNLATLVPWSEQVFLSLEASKNNQATV